MAVVPKQLHRDCLDARGKCLWQQGYNEKTTLSDHVLLVQGENSSVSTAYRASKRSYLFRRGLVRDEDEEQLLEVAVERLTEVSENLLGFGVPPNPSFRYTSARHRRNSVKELIV